MAEYKPGSHILVLFLGLLLLLSTSAIPVTRSFFSNKAELPIQTSTIQGAMDQKSDKMFDVGEEVTEGRMDLETKDYPGTGPNNHHDPNPPGKSG